MISGFIRLKALIEHIPANLFIGGVFWLFDQKIEYFLIALTFGWLIDADHIFDYLIWAKRCGSKLSVFDFISGFYFEKNKKVFVLLHSFELTAGLALASIFIENNRDFLLVAAMAHAVHLIHDQISYRPVWVGYFFIARYLHQFSQAWFCQKICNNTN